MASASRAGILRHSDDLVTMLKPIDKWLLNKVLQESLGAC